MGVLTLTTCSATRSSGAAVSPTSRAEPDPVFLRPKIVRMMFDMTANAAVERPRAALSSAARVHNEMTHLRHARDDVSPESSLEKVDTRWLVALALELHR